MVKGVAIKFQSYQETIPKLLSLLKFDKELKKHNSVVIKPFLQSTDSVHTPIELTEAVLRYVLSNKNPVAQVFIAEGSDGEETEEVYNALGYSKLAEKYSVGLLDLNSTETQEIEHYKFEKFDRIHYPKILLESFVISIVKPSLNEELDFIGSMSNMIGAYPASHYQGFFSSNKNKIRKNPMKYAIHDIIACKMPDFAIIDNSQNGSIMAGLPLDVDKQVAKSLGLELINTPHLKLIDESFSKEEEQKK